MNPEEKFLLISHNQGRSVIIIIITTTTTTTSTTTTNTTTFMARPTFKTPANLAFKKQDRT